MANQQHLDLLLQGVDIWNQWRKEHPRTQPDLSRAFLGEAHLSGADLSRAHLIGAYLTGTQLHSANLRKAHLHGASLSDADLSQADLTQADFGEAHLYSANLTGAHLQGALLANADLVEANLSFAYLREANLSGANLSGADLSCASMVWTNLKEANLTGCSIFGISAWNVDLEGAIQSHLILTEESEPTITVDNLEVAQFIYLLLNNQKIRDVINTITSKVVLILGRFTPERKAILEAVCKGRLDPPRERLDRIRTVFAQRPCQANSNHFTHSLSGRSSLLLI